MDWAQMFWRLVQDFPALTEYTADLNTFIAAVRRLAPGYAAEVDHWARMENSYASLSQGADGAYFLHWAGVTWVKYHLPLFHLTRELMALFALTDFGATPFAEVPWPFPAFMINLPRGWDATRASGTVRFDRILIGAVSADLLGGLQRFNFVTWSVLNRTAVHESTSALAVVDREQTVASWWRAVRGQTCAAEDQTIAKAALNVAIGTALYVAEHGKGPQVNRHTTKRVRRRQESGAIFKPTIWQLSAPIPVGRELVEAAESISEFGDSPRWRVKARFVVRGHWRNQACGAGRTERRGTWIHPHWKGPTDGDRLLRTYNVESTAGKQET